MTHSLTPLPSTMQEGHFLDIDLGNLETLTNQNYVLIGDSASISSFSRYIADTQASVPNKTIITDEQEQQSISLENDDPNHTCIVVCSTINKIKVLKAIPQIERFRIFDVSSLLLNNFSYYHGVADSPYIVFFCANPVDRHDMWTHTFETWLNQQGVQLIYRHPLQKVPSGLLTQSEGIVFWGGSICCFEVIKAQLAMLNLPYSFCECGFFPQADYVYFDTHGINVESALAEDNLAWLPNDYTSIVAQKRHVFFEHVPAYTEHTDYIFVPLQLANDSNIQAHSRFTQGMQEFVDYIEGLYPNEKLVFKTHPRDTHKYQSQSENSVWSNASSQSLIKSAKRVHGINSTVLFEAALYGVDIITEGDSLLARHQGQINKLLAAMILRQCNVQTGDFSKDKLEKFSHLRFR